MRGAAHPARRGFMRPMGGWWRRDAFFMRYMAREATAIAVLVYAVILAVGLVRLAQGEAAWNGWLAALRSPWSIALHVLLLLSMVVHAHSWFEIMPKTMPMLFAGGKRVGEAAIMRTGWTAAVVASLALFALAWWLR
jgi:fumarate reductase subunit C